MSRPRASESVTCDLARMWYICGVKTTIDKAGRVVIPAAIRAKAGLKPGTELEVVMDDISIRLIPSASEPSLVRSGDRWVVRPTAEAEELPEVDLTALIEEERNRWPF